MKTNWIWILIGVTFCVILVVYFAAFHGNLSAFSQDWASFGSYVSGIMMPILTAINIWVFIKLTRAIDDNNEKRVTNKEKIEQNRHKEELAFQRKLIESKIRNNELMYFVRLFDEIGIGNDITERVNRYKTVMEYADNFKSEKSTLFDSKDICNLMSHLREELNNKYEEARSNRVVDIDTHSTVMPIKNQIVKLMYEYIFDEIDDSTEL